MARSNLSRNMLLGGVVLGVFAVIATAIVAFTFENTREQIAENERQALLRGLHELVPATRHDNDLYADMIEMSAESLTRKGNRIPVYRARKNGEPIAAILQVVAPDGYSGPIRLLVGINYDGVLTGVRVVSHKETPGLGDAIEIERSNWIRAFDGKSLDNPSIKGWRVRKDGGSFDQLTGATITPRAVVKAVRKSLEFYQAHRNEIFNRQSAAIER